MKYIKIVVPIFLVLMFFGCGKKDENLTTQSTTSLLATETTVAETTTETTTVKTTAKVTTKATTGVTETTLAKKAVYSVDLNNPFIKAVVSKYGVDSSNLVALYSDPPDDGNMVLQFNGSTDANGKKIRNKDTLKVIYTVDVNYNCKKATESLLDNADYNYIERQAMFYTVKNYVLPEFQDKLNS